MNNHYIFPQLLSSSFILVDTILCTKRIHASLKSIQDKQPLEARQALLSQMHGLIIEM